MSSAQQGSPATPIAVPALPQLQPPTSPMPMWAWLLIALNSTGLLTSLISGLVTLPKRVDDLEKGSIVINQKIDAGNAKLDAQQLKLDAMSIDIDEIKRHYEGNK
jgi:hypothetical protein